jgi:hypothetical protein
VFDCGVAERITPGDAERAAVAADKNLMHTKPPEVNTAIDLESELDIPR